MVVCGPREAFLWEVYDKLEERRNKTRRKKEMQKDINVRGKREGKEGRRRGRESEQTIYNEH